MNQAFARAGVKEAASDRLRVLLVDDDADDRLIIADLLAAVPSVGQVDTVGTFQDAREAIFRRSHDVYLVDYRLGARTGLELIEAAGSRVPGPFIILTGLNDQDVDVMAAAAGAYDYLDKDRLDVASLTRAIRYSTALWHANEQLHRRAERQGALARLSRRAVDAVDLSSFVAVALEDAAEILDVGCGAVVRIDPISGDRTPVASIGACDDGPPGAAEEHSARSSLTQLIADGVAWGVLEFHSHRSDHFQADDFVFAESLANLIAAVVDRAEASETRDRLAEILGATPDFAGTIDTTGRVTYLNRTGRALMGCVDGDLPEDLRYDRFHPEWVNEMFESTAFPIALDRGWWSGRSALIGPDENELPVSQVIIVHRDTHGAVTHMSTVAHDLTDDIATERALAESRAMVAKAFNESPIGKAITTPSGEFVSVNKAFEELMGYSADELIGKNAIDFVHPADRESIEAQVADLHAGAVSRSGLEARLLTRELGARWALVTISVIPAADGRTEHVVVQVQDLETQKQASEQIRFQASLLDQVHNAVVATGLDGAVTYWNRSAEKMFGWSAEESLGRSIFEIIGLDPDPAAQAKAMVDASLARTGAWEGEAVVTRKDGSTFTAWMSDALLFDDEANPVGVIGIKADVTHLRHIEGEARRQEALAASVLRSVPFPVAVIDPTGVITAVNRAWTQFAVDNGGTEESTGVGMNYLDVCRAATGDPEARRALEGIEGVLSGDTRSFVLEYECAAPEEERWFEMECHPVPGEGAVVVHWNVTAERLHRMALEETIDAKDRFIASLSHELRTPLTAVVGLAEELRTGDYGVEETREFQTVIADQALELSLLVDDLLIAARIDSGTLTVVPSRVAVREELEHVVAPWLSDGSRVIRVEAEDGVVAWADAGRVRQVLRNLVSNAIRYGADPIEVRIAAHGPRVVVEVTDHGPGIPEAARSRMFQPYSTFSTPEGLTASVGLGLHVSRDLATRMGGSLDYRREGGLTIFELILPSPAALVHGARLDR